MESNYSSTSLTSSLEWRVHRPDLFRGWVSLGEPGKGSDQGLTEGGVSSCRQFKHTLDLIYSPFFENLRACLRLSLNSIQIFFVQGLPQGIDLIYRFDPQGRISYLNHKAMSTFGLNPDEVMGKSYLDFVHVDFREKVSDFYQKQIKLKQASSYLEFPMISGEREIWIGQSIELVIQDNSVVEVLGVARPISELKQVKAELEKSDTHLIALMEHIDAAILIENEAGLVQYGNQNFCDYFRLSKEPEELKGIVCADLVAEIAQLIDDPGAYIEENNSLLAKGQLKRSERISLKDERVLERDYIPMKSNSGFGGHLWVYRDVTLRYLTELALKESEKKYREVIQNIDLGLMEVDNEERIIWANAPFLKATGHELDDIKGRDAKSVFLKEEDQRLHQELLTETQQRRAQGEFSAYELPIRHSNGDRLWMMISGAAIKDISGNVVGSLGIHHNVSQQKELQEQLEYRNKLQEILLDLANDLILFNPNREREVIQTALASMGSFVHADRVYIFDYNLERNTTSNTFEWCASGVSPEIDNLQDVPLEAIPDWYDTHARGEAMVYDKVTDLPKGHPVREILEPQGIKSIITVPIMGDGMLHGFIGFDAVKEHKRWTEDETELLEFMAQMLAAHNIRQDIAKKLSDSEFRMRTVLENALDAVITINEEGHIESWNRQAEEIFKYRESEVLGSPLTGKIIPEKFASAHERGIEHFIKTGEGPVLNKRIELIAHDKDMHHFPVELSIIPFKVDDKYFFSSFLRDITARKKAEEDMNIALEQQMELARMKSRLISMASHEFRTPLTTIKANAEMLELWTQKLPKEHKIKALKYLDRLGRETNRLSNIMTDILVLGRLESGRIKIDRRSLDLVNFLKDLIDRHWSNQSDGRHIRFVLGGGPRLVNIDPELLEHIVQNLIDNAFKYSQGAEEPELHLQYGADQARLSIRDHGIGVPIADNEKIFNSFYRAENTHGIQGSGMGLAVVKQMSDMQGLNLRFYSKEGEGSEFVIDIPLTS